MTKGQPPATNANIKASYINQGTQTEAGPRSTDTATRPGIAAHVSPSQRTDSSGDERGFGRQHVADSSIAATKVCQEPRTGVKREQHHTNVKQYEHQQCDEVSLCETHGADAKGTRPDTANSGITHVQQETDRIGSVDTETPPTGSNAQSNEPDNATYEEKRGHSNDDRLENGQQVGRGSQANAPKLYRRYTNAGGSRLDDNDESSKNSTIPPRPIHSNNGPMDSGDSDVRNSNEPNNHGGAGNNRTNQCGSEEGIRTGSDNARDQARSGTRIDATSSGTEHPNHRRDVASKAQKYRNDHQIRGTEHNHGASARNSKGNGSVVERRLGIRRRPTTVATVEDGQYPLHAHKVGTIDLNKIRAMMLPQVTDRFNAIYAALTAPPLDTEYKTGTTMNDGDIKVLLDCGIIECAPQNTKTTGWIIPFTTVEERDGLKRRRFITWTRDANYYNRHYEADIDLGNIAAQVRQVHAAVGVKRDLTAGFYQVPLPETAKPSFRFKGADGTIFQLRRMPMGHVCAPELMQIITATLAGCAKHCCAEYQLITNVDVYIDGFRATGTVAEMTAYEAAVETRAKTVGATFKATDSVRGTSYEFNGVDYNHDTKTVALSKKLTTRMGAWQSKSVTAQEVEQHMGRLLYASRIMGVAMVRYYFAIKYVRRIINDMNRGRKNPSDQVTIPPGIAGLLRQWTNAVTPTKRYGPPVTADTTAALNLFTDASLTGWGAVLLMPDGDLHVTGARWQKTPDRIDVAEMEAVEFAIRAFATHFADHNTVILHVDNTSVQGVVRRGSTQSQELALAAQPVLNAIGTAGMVLKVVRITTKDNPADRPSRA